ncbi:MAG: tRNA lysidine(34) synthetase TilS [Bacteroidetes bacterium]|nr:tRNA lysidine(34) synthetase TilS [Bacteroidota bacterium]
MSSKTLQVLDSSIDSLIRVHAPTVWQGHGLVVGVSGGVDSMVLLEAISRWYHKQTGVGDIHIAHVNYGLRGEESDMDEQFVKETARRLGMQIHIHRANRNYQGTAQNAQEKTLDTTPGNLQEWAREERFTFFGEIARGYDIACVLLAHHQDDQLETILQRLFRGAGLEALRGLQAMTSLSGFGLEVLRPCLGLSKAQLLDVANELGITYREDSTNATEQYARNVLRHSWIPSMDSMFPGWRKHVIGLESVSQTASALADVVMSQVVDKDELLRSPWQELHVDVQSFVLHRWLTSHGVSPSRHSIAMLMESLPLSHPGQTFEIEPNTSIEGTKKGFIVATTADSSELTFPISWRLEEFTNHLPQQWKDPFTLYGVLQAGEKVESFRVRPIQGGDKFQPFGMVTGHQQIADFLSNRGITGSAKSQAAVVVDAQEDILAVLYPVEEISRLGAMGEVSNTRRVPDLTNGKDRLFRIQPSSSDPWSATLRASEQPISLVGMTFRPMILEHDIRRRIHALALEIRQEAQTWGVSQENPLHVITVLQGAVPFARDLSRELQLPCVFDTVHLSSYKGGMSSTGEIERKSWLTSPIQGQHVLVVEDIVDTGRTLEMFTKELAKQKPASVKIAALCRKKEAMEVELPIDYVGFDITPDFVLGYGMDVNELGRNLPHIYVKMA